MVKKTLNNKEEMIDEFNDVKSPEELNEETKNLTETDYSKYIEENEEVKNFLEYARLKDRVDQGKAISEQEKVWLKSINEETKIKEEAEKHAQQIALEEAERQKQYEEEIMNEYKKEKKEHPEKITITDTRNKSLVGGESVIKMIKFALALKKAKQKGGKVLCQVTRGRKVKFEVTNRDISFVEFWSKDEKGNDLLEVTRFSEFPYSFEGTPVPVLFAVQGYAEGFDFYKDFRKDLTAELLSRISTRSFITGYMKGAEVRNPQEKKNQLEALQSIAPIVLIAAIFILGMMMYQMYNDTIAIKASLEALKAASVTVIP